MKADSSRSSHLAKASEASALFSIGESVGVGVCMLLAIYLGALSMCTLHHFGRDVSELSLTSWGAWIDPLQPWFSLLLFVLPIQLIFARGSKRAYGREPQASVKERSWIFVRVVMRTTLIWVAGMCIFDSILTALRSDGSVWRRMQVLSGTA